MRIYLITHAHTEQLPNVAADRWCLSARGVEQAEMLARAPFWAEIDRVILSSEPKTWLTVEGIATARGLPVWIDARFDEMRRGGWIENYADQVAKAFVSPDKMIGEWESVDAVRSRALRGLEDLQRRFAHETLALVGHGLCLSILRAEILGHVPVDFAAWQQLAFASVACVEWTPRKLLFDFELSAHNVRA